MDRYGKGGILPEEGFEMPEVGIRFATFSAVFRGFCRRRLEAATNLLRFLLRFSALCCGPLCTGVERRAC